MVLNFNIVEWREIVCIGCGLVGRDFVEIAKRYENTYLWNRKNSD